jgi:hypothetical protein
MKGNRFGWGIKDAWHDYLSSAVQKKNPVISPGLPVAFNESA